jgi:hypothetical protein
MFVVKSNRPGFETVTLTATTTLAAVDEAAALLPADPDAWARIDDKWVSAGWPGLIVPAAWNVTFPPHGNAQQWVEWVE